MNKHYWAKVNDLVGLAFEVRNNHTGELHYPVEHIGHVIEEDKHDVKVHVVGVGKDFTMRIGRDLLREPKKIPLVQLIG